MTETKFTPGPWRAFKNSSFWEIVSDEGQIGDVCASDFLGDGTQAPNPVAASNAHLIAAAPELYAALEAYHFHFGPLEDNYMLHPDARNCMKLAIAALAKARGESQ